MIVVAVDPGETIGLAYIHAPVPEKHQWDAHQTSNVQEADDWIDSHLIGHTNDATLVLEDFISSGNLTKEAKTTLRILGFLDIKYSQYSTLVVPQKRKAFVNRALELTQNRDIPGPHSVDALAHALRYAYTCGIEV